MLQSELSNASEFIDDNNNPLLRQTLSSGIIGLTNNLNVTSATGLLAPQFLNFPTAGISNGNASRFFGINDFSAYNDYIHYTGTTVKKMNVMNNLIYSVTRYSPYGR